MENSERHKTVVAGQTAGPVSGQSTRAQPANQPGRGQYSPGEVLGGTYKIIDFLGQGGMGFVYRVEHLLLAKELALKVLRSDQVSEVIWRRFQTEAQAIARLDHANIVKIYDMGQTEDGVPYYTMDLLVGESLADYLDQNDFLAVEQALPLFRQICAGLAYAHDRGIIHRDIKPPNIMLLEGSQLTVKIVDFGIAKLNIDGQPGQGLTRPGEVFGSPLYMSPEQCLGLPIDHRTDIYSTGITFFEALTGRAPFIGRSAVETTAMHQSDLPPSLKDIGEIDYPKELERIVAKMLAKAPEQRYQSLADTAKDLLLLERSLGRLTHSHSDSHSSSRSQASNLSVDETQDSADLEDVEQSLTERIKSSAKPLAAVLLTLVVTAVIVHQILSSPPKPAKLPASPEATNKTATNKEQTAKQNLSATDTSARPTEAIESEDDVFIRQRAKKLDPMFAPEIGPNKPQFSKVIGRGAAAMRRFSMPEEFSLGTIKYGLHAAKQHKAQGTFELPENEVREFHPNQPAVTHSMILRRFRDGDFQIFNCEKIQGAHDDLIDNISHINSITSLQMNGNDFTNASIKYIEKLTKLKNLGVTQTAITGQALAESNIPSRIHRINLSNEDATALVKAMRNSQKATYLSLEASNIGGPEIEILSTMPQLTRLEIGCNKLNDNDLKPLAKLKKLQILELTGCRQLTAGIIPTMIQLPKLQRLKLSLNNWSAKEKKLLYQALPPGRVQDSDNRDAFKRKFE